MSYNSTPYGYFDPQEKASRMTFPTASTYVPTSNYPPPVEPARMKFPTPSMNSPPPAVPTRMSFPSPSTNSSNPPVYFGQLTSEPSSFLHNGYSQGAPTNRGSPAGGFYLREASFPVPIPSNDTHSRGHQPSRQFSRSTYPDLTSPSSPPGYSNPPSYSSPFASSGASTSSYSGSSITADGLRPLGLQFDMIELGMLEMMTCKELFAGWATELNGFSGRHKGDLESRIVERIYTLREGASTALDTSRQLLISYNEFALVMDNSLQEISRASGGQLYPNDSLQSLHWQISAQTTSLNTHVKNMKENVLELADLLSKTKHDADKHAFRARVWGWLVKVFKALSVLFDVGAELAPVFDPLGTAVAPVMQGLSTLASYAAKLCKEMEHRSYERATFDKILDLLSREVPESAARIELALGKFHNSLLIIEAGNEVSDGPRSGWVEPHEATKAAKDWRNTRDVLVKITRSYTL